MSDGFDDQPEAFDPLQAGGEEVIEQVPEQQAWVHALTSQTPWWLISVVFHVLMILLAAVVSSAIEIPDNSEPLVTVSALIRPTDNADQKEVKKEVKSALAADRDTNPTDPNSKEMSVIEVPPDILAKAELGDHFETINPDRPDTHSAFGNPDAHMFHSVKGSDDAAGGGGAGGSSLDDLTRRAGGAASPGSGGGWGGGVGTGVGNDKGSGRGSFGNRNGGGRRLMVKRHGGSKQTENGVDAALRWLAYHQETDGHWDAKKYSAPARRSIRPAQAWRCSPSWARAIPKKSANTKTTSSAPWPG